MHKIELNHVTFLVAGVFPLVVRHDAMQSVFARSRELGLALDDEADGERPASVTWHSTQRGGRELRVDDVYRVFVERFDVVAESLEFHGSLDRAGAGFVRAGDVAERTDALVGGVAARVAARMAGDSASSSDAPPPPPSLARALNGAADKDKHDADADDEFFAAQAAAGAADAAASPAGKKRKADAVKVKKEKKRHHRDDGKDAKKKKKKKSSSSDSKKRKKSSA